MEDSKQDKTVPMFSNLSKEYLKAQNFETTVKCTYINKDKLWEVTLDKFPFATTTAFPEEVTDSSLKLFTEQILSCYDLLHEHLE